MTVQCYTQFYQPLFTVVAVHIDSESTFSTFVESLFYICSVCTPKTQKTISIFETFSRVCAVSLEEQGRKF